MANIEELKTSDKAFLDAADIAPFLRCDAQDIRSQAQSDPRKLGFPVCVVGVRVKIPRDGFIQWYMGGGSNDR